MLDTRSLSHLICDSMNLEYRSDYYFDAMGLCVRYIVGLDSAFDFQHKLNAMPWMKKGRKTSAKAFRMMMMGSMYIYRDLKFYICNLSYKRGVDLDYVKNIREHFNVFNSDSYWIFTVLTETNGLRKEIKQSPKLKGLTLADVSPVEYRLMNETFKTAYGRILTFIKSATYRKLRFVSSSTNTEFTDMYNDISIKAMSAFYSCYPLTKTFAYVMNYVNRSITNHVLNMVNMATSKKRARIVNVGKDKHGFDQFELLAVSENQFRKNKDGEYSSYEDMLSNQLLDDQLDQTETSYSIEQILVKAKPKKRKFLQVISGQLDNKFTRWLIDNKHISKRSTMTNVEFQDKCCPRLFIELLRDFMDLKKEQCRKFLRSIHHALTGERNENAASYL